MRRGFKNDKNGQKARVYNVHLKNVIEFGAAGNRMHGDRQPWFVDLTGYEALLETLSGGTDIVPQPATPSLHASESQRMARI